MVAACAARRAGSVTNKLSRPRVTLAAAAALRVATARNPLLAHFPECRLGFLLPLPPGFLLGRRGVSVPLRSLGVPLLANAGLDLGPLMAILGDRAQTLLDRPGFGFPGRLHHLAGLATPASGNCAFPAPRVRPARPAR